MNTLTRKQQVWIVNDIRKAQRNIKALSAMLRAKCLAPEDADAAEWEISYQMILIRRARNLRNGGV